jgi:hypothetical protein
MKTLITAAMYAAIVTQSEGCDIIKRLTGKPWPEVPFGTRRFLVIAAVWSAIVLFLIARYLLTKSNNRINERDGKVSDERDFRS